MAVLIDCDMGEGYGLYRCGDDEGIMSHVTHANVACGFHAADPVIMRQTIALAKAHGVAVGAHPSFPDLQGFGRREMRMDRAEIAACVLYQVGALKAFLDEAGMELSHIKPHGALYGVASRDEAIAEGIADAACVYGVKMLGLAGTEHERVWRRRGLDFVAEYYVDLDYTDDGRIIITREHAARDPDEAARRVTRMLREGIITTINGHDHKLRAEAICVHSDTPNAVALASAVRRAVADCA